jgi:hypothetical protein
MWKDVFGNNRAVGRKVDKGTIVRCLRLRPADSGLNLSAPKPGSTVVARFLTDLSQGMNSIATDPTYELCQHSAALLIA